MKGTYPSVGGVFEVLKSEAAEVTPSITKQRSRRIVSRLRKVILSFGIGLFIMSISLKFILFLYHYAIKAIDILSVL